MKNTLLSLIVLLYYIPCNSQEFNGKVIDKETKMPIQYAIIKIKDKDIGYVCDSNGYFNLSYKELSLDDFILINNLGYKDTLISVSDLTLDTPNILYINSAPLPIKEVVVTGNKMKDVKLGISNTGTRMYSTPLYIKKELNDGKMIGREFGTAINIKKDSYIKELAFFLKRNNYDKIKLRILFYRVKNKEVKELIVDKDIIFEISNRDSGWISTDLSSYDITFNKGQEILVSLMTLDQTNKHEFWINATNLSNNGIYRRDNVLGNWKRGSGGISLYLRAFIEK